MITAISLPIILAAAAFLRFYKNTAIALWHDEAFSALYIQYPWPEMMYRIGLDVHPPLYYVLLRFWSMAAGDGLLALRLFSILFGALTVWAVYLFIRAAFENKHYALLAALFVAVNPFQIQYALEARMYTLGTFLLAISSYFLTRALDNKRFWVWYGLAAAASLYTHYFLAFSVAAQGLFILIHIIKTRRVKNLLYAAGSYLLAFLIYAPWLPTLLEQVRRVEQSFWIPAMSRWSVPGTVWKMVFGGGGARNAVLAAATAVALLTMVYFVKKVRGFQKWHILLLTLIPILSAVAISMKNNLYLDRYFVFASLYFSMMIALAFAAIPNRFLRLSLISLLLAGSVFAFLKNWDDLGIENKPGMAAAAALLNEKAGPADRIYVGSSFVYFTFKYYNETGVQPLLVSSEPLEKIPHFSGTAILREGDLILDLTQTRKNNIIWLIWTTGFGGSKTPVPANWQQLEETGHDDAPGFKGTIYVTKYKVN